MEIEIWEGGLKEQEIEAINTIKATFTSKNQKRGDDGSMYPWKGYAGFRFVDSKIGKEGEFDLVIITHCNILVIELKDWNYDSITAVGDTWFKGKENRGKSPVSVTRGKKFLLDNKIKPLKQQFTNKDFLPKVDFFVVMTGNSPFNQLPEDQRHHTISLKNFLKFANNKYFQDYFKPHSGSKVLNQDFHVFDKLFIGKSTEPKPLRFNGYEAKDLIFEHPKKVYREFLAKSELSTNQDALLRIWDLKQVKGNKAFSPEGWAKFVSREREVLQYIHHQNRDLYNHCLRSLTSFQKDSITLRHCEVYELPPGHIRFNEFIGKYGKNLSEYDRLVITKLLIAKFGDLHEIKVAHRDIADHCLWISPAKEIALSNFISAYYQPIGTVGDYRQSLSVGAVEAKDMLEDNQLTPFQMDVHSLGVIAWHLLTAQRMSPKSLASIQEDILSSNEWYVPVLLDAVTANYKTAADFFDGLKKHEPIENDFPTFDDSELERYRQPINHSRQFREDDSFLVETTEKEVYFSNGRLVKAWLNTGGKGNDPVINFNILSFLKQTDKLYSAKPAYLPPIYEYGIALKSSSLYLVTDGINGKTWAETEISDDDKEHVITQFIAAIEDLHTMGISHGDIHPENVMLETDTNNLYLIDIPDFSFSGEETKNHLYSPENIDHCTAFERDNFAVMKMSCELLGMTWAADSEVYPTLANRVKEELTDSQLGLKSLERFKKALSQIYDEVESPLINIIMTNNIEPITIWPDNGRLFVEVVLNDKDKSQLKVIFNGIGGSFTAIYCKNYQYFLYGFSPYKRSTIYRPDINEYSFEINAILQITSGKTNDLSTLTDLLNSCQNFISAIKWIDESNTTDNVGELNIALQDAFKRLENTVDNQPKPIPKLNISTNQLWRAILDTETESYPNIEVNEQTPPFSKVNGELIIPYYADIDPLGAFGNTDEIEALLIDNHNDEKLIGVVSLEKSSLNEICLKFLRQIAYRLKDGDIIYFRSKQDRASYRKRKVALERLLSGKGAIPELMNLFDPACEIKAMDYGISISEDEFSYYDRVDLHGHKISLNTQQREAFEKLINYGPLSLLQGPPGTGKTEFIAAFVHYLIEKQQVKRILLVSQSHEAVNTAAERIRKHCIRLKTDLEIVRFSNREGAVSKGLKDVYSHAITTTKRELFSAEYKYRVESLSAAIGLEPAFLSSYVGAELKIFRPLEKLKSLTTPQEGLTKEDIKSIKKISQSLHNLIQKRLNDEYDIKLEANQNIFKIKDILISKLCQDYRVRPDELKKVDALAKLSQDMLDALSGEYVNYDEFYARSRQLVVGTCVGIGQGHIGIQNNVYDWVIIDEAARSIASELAIAMQSAKRVLLVGDHLQLPPLYSDMHKKALAKKLGIRTERNDIDDIVCSDFARVFNSNYGKQVSATLLTQYRMAPPIGNLVSAIFYDKKLKNGDRTIPDIYKNVPDFLQSVVSWIDTSVLGTMAHHQDDHGLSIYNRCEADQIIVLLKQISSNLDFVKQLADLSDEDDAAIGIICMYAEQKRILRQKFNQEIWLDGFKELVKIDTVDSYQGKENRIVILSLTRSDKDCTAGFLRAPNRINVAMSRAKDRLVIIGNTRVWKGQNTNLPLGLIINYMTEHGESAGYKFLNAKVGADINNDR